MTTNPPPAESANPTSLEPQVSSAATPSQCVEMWIDLMNACDEFLLAALRREIGPDGDLRAAYRRWYWRQMEDHDQALFRMLRRLDAAWKEDGS
ncbi:MAG TPA: hypothetical protein VF278_21540 [Pirellulales bacterium]